MDSTTLQLVASLPANLLRVSYLVGKIPFRICHADTRISYTLYIPEQQYWKVHEALQQDHPSDSDRLPLIVNVHGTRRDAVTARDSLIDYADRHGCAILAPLFPAAIEGPLDLDAYKKLRTRSLKADLILINIIDEVKQIWQGINTDSFTLVGCSGGGQFAHRFMYFHPERLRRVCVAAPGQVTKIGSGAWPGGLDDVEKVFDGKPADLQGARDIEHVAIVIGEDDHDTEDQKRLKQWLNQAVKRNAQPVEVAAAHPRVEMCRQLQQNWAANGIDAEMIIVPGVAHSYVGLAPAIVAWLERTE